LIASDALIMLGEASMLLAALPDGCTALPTAWLARH